MTIFELIGGVITTVTGFVVAFFGWCAVSAGRGGYGYGPLPMLRQPTEYDLIGLGVALVALGSVVISAGLHLLGVFGT